MDFISNLIKRPISLVLNETPPTIDKFAISTSLPTAPSELENKRDLALAAANEPQNPAKLSHNNCKLSLSLSSSYNGDNMSDFIGVPRDFLDEFKDILPHSPPPPLPLEHVNPLTQTLFDMDNMDSSSISPPPPPLSPTSSMNVSQTIDEFLLQINDNLQQAGLSDDTLTIGPPSSKSELTPLSSKVSLNNQKLVSSYSSACNIQLNSSKTAPANSAVQEYENNSSLSNVHIESELGNGIKVNDHKLQQQQKFEQAQEYAVKDQSSDSGVNKLSNKFVGLTEFDESKIPELPGDINPDIEGQYCVTAFEECFVSNLNDHLDANSRSSNFTDELGVGKTHHLLPTETDCLSSDNETFADCNDEKDPLTSTFAEPASLDITELESYQSAVNKSMDSNFNSTMDNIADITMEAVNYPLKNNDHIQTANQCLNEHIQSQVESMDEVEPMDVDLNATIEIIHNTSNNIQHVDRVLQHVDNIFQHLDVNTENLASGLSEKQKDSSEIVCARNPPIENNENNGKHLDIEHCSHELSLNKSIELPVNKLKTSSSECIIENLNKNVTQAQEENYAVALTKNQSDNNINLKNYSNVSSNHGNFSAKSAVDNMGASINSQQSSISPSRSFPIKTTEIAGFPRSPKALTDKSLKCPFLEKSDYMANIETQAVENDSNAANSVANILGGPFSKTALAFDENEKNSYSKVDNSMAKEGTEEQEINNTEFQNNRQALSIDIPNEEKRRTFCVQSNENTATAILQFPSTDKRRTFAITDSENMPNDLNPRPTFNLPSDELISKSTEQTGSNTNFESIEVDKNISENFTLPISTDLTQKSQSPSLLPMQSKEQSPPLPAKSSLPVVPKSLQTTILPTMQPGSQSPPLPTKQLNSPSPPTLPNKREKISPLSFASQPLTTLIQKRPSIRDARARTADILSAKEQSNIKVKDEKDVFVEKPVSSPIEDVFTVVTATSTTLTNSSDFSEFDQTSSSFSSMTNTTGQQSKPQLEDEFNGNNLILNPSDFDYLLTKGNNNAPVDRSSLLLKFDPLLGVPVPVNQGQNQLQQLQISTNTNNPCLSPTREEDEHNDSNRSFVIDIKSDASAKLLKERSLEVKQQLQLEQQVHQAKRQITTGTNKKNATMSVDVIKDMSLDNDCNKAFENSNSTQSDDKQINYKMDELEKKIKNEVLKTEDIEKKLKDAEQREEALIKRITEKDKTIAKMTGVIEAYEKAIAELIADKEQLTQHYEKQLAEVKADRDSNYHHLTSLETTFSDLHVKYEKSKEMTCQLKESEEALQAEKRKNLENLHLQEQRYDKMKNHAMQQLEIANKKLESLTREHSIELTKLKALLKKEEIARSSINEQLAHKTKENAELVKICDELISGQGSNYAFEPYDSKKH